jgi:hypothetical protein
LGTSEDRGTSCCLRIDDIQAKGYLQEEMLDAFRRYIPRSEIDRIHEEFATEDKEAASDRSADILVRETPVFKR